MPSSYTSSLRLTLPVQGELSGTWGDTVNTGITSLTDAAIAGTAAVTMTDADYTLTSANGATDQARNMFVVLTGTLTASRNVICPTASKLYFVYNNTSGSQNIVFKTSAGTGVTVPSGAKMALYCDGTNVVDAVTNVSALKVNNVDVVTTSASQTLTNKTLTAPVISTISNTGTITLPTSTDTLVGRATTDTLTNKTLSTGSTWQGSTVGVAYGGTGQTTYTDGQLLIGNTTGNTLTKATLTQGTGITVTNGSGAITIANAGVTSITGTASQVTASASTGGVTLSLPATINVNTSGNAATVTNGVYTTGDQTIGGIKTFSSTISGSISGNAGTVTNGVYTSGSYADPAWLTSLAGSKVSGNISGNAGNVTGTVAVTNGGTGQTTYLDGQILIGNSLGNTLTKSTLTAGTGVSITNGNGSITIAATGSGGTVTSVAVSGGTTGLTTSGGPITGSGTITLAGTLAVANGGTGATTAAGARTGLGATTVGANLFTLTNPSAITFPRFNADNTVSALDAATFRTAIGAGTGSGTVTSVAVSGGTTGLTTSGGPVTGSGTITLAGTLAVANGGTGQTSYTDGQLLIGNSTGNTLSKATLTQGTGITITNGSGAITVANSGVTSVAGTASQISVSASSGAVTFSLPSTINVNTSGNAANVTGTVAIANGGTGATSAASALVTLGVRTSATGSFITPTGTTAQRDGTPLTGYLRFNTTLGTFEGYNGSVWGSIGGGASAGVFYENDQAVTADYTVTSGKNAMSAGPITVNTGVTVTVPSGSVWTVV